MTSAAPTDLDAPPADAPRFLRAFWRLVRWALPEAFRFFGTYEYRIATVYQGHMLDGEGNVVDGPVLDLQATDDTAAIGLTDIPKALTWPGIAGAKPTPTAGSRVLVQFINGNPARPIVVAWAPAGDSGWLPSKMVLDATGTVQVGGGVAAAIVVDKMGSLTAWFNAVRTGITSGGGTDPGPVPGCTAQKGTAA